MNYDEATVMAYVDGECDAVTAKRIEKAMETDVTLSKQVEQAQALRSKLSAHYNPVAEEAVPDHLTAMLTASAACNIDSSFTARRDEQELGKQRRSSMGIAQWGAMAATLALGIAVGQYGLAAARTLLLPSKTVLWSPAGRSKMRWKPSSLRRRRMTATIASA